jgi:thiamine pyrophosphate-dependent acetolactate synthase large subunit-like protein
MHSTIDHAKGHKSQRLNKDSQKGKWFRKVHKKDKTREQKKIVKYVHKTNDIEEDIYSCDYLHNQKTYTRFVPFYRWRISEWDNWDYIGIISEGIAQYRSEYPRW